MGSVYLLLLTNIGARLGVMLAGAALGWLTIMGGIWWTYGTIGMLGEINHWEVVETVYPGLENAVLTDARGRDTSGLPDAEELNDLTDEELSARRADLEAGLDGWRLLPESNPSFGEAKAAVDEYFIEHPNTELAIDNAEDYVTLYSFERGGKDRLPENPSRLDRITKKLKTTFVELTHPPHYALIQVQPVVVQEPVPGEPPPTPRADESQPVVSVVMERDLGDRRFPGAMLTLFSWIDVRRVLRPAAPAGPAGRRGAGAGACHRGALIGWGSTSPSSSSPSS